MDVLTASSLPQGIANTPDMQPAAQNRPMQAPEAPPAARQTETVTSVEVQISDAARAVAARDQAGGARPATDNAALMQRADNEGAQAAAVPRSGEGRATQEALRMFMDNAGVGVEQATTNASPLRTSA